MQWLNQETVTEHLNMQAAIDTIEALLRRQAAHPSWIKSPERLVIETFSDELFSNSSTHSSGTHLSMPATIYDGQQEYTAVKLVTICPDNPGRNLPTTTAIITVSDNATGEVLAVMDGIYITQVRTAALSGIATKYMAPDDCQRVAVVGCGGMAYEQLNAVLTVRPEIKTVYLWNRSHEGAESFKNRFAHDYQQWNVELIVCEQLEDAIKDADIINVATRAKSGLFSVDQIKPNVHINAVGAYQALMKEISNDVIAASYMIVVDDLVGSHHEAGDLIQAHNATDCTWTWDELNGDLQALVTGKTTPSSKEQATKAEQTITLFKSVGAASFDAAVAVHITELAQQKNLGIALY
ncbi:ornithine cyclodeaminase/alanine dehydrogenase-like protein (mu-crystallin family) [Psychrobacter sp. PL15]|uniref:ornithine cyclodeaminase family protein n=1 Tax=Psychrobacter sp. PL15 TaxID=3071719 RepID=UPI002DF87E28|nr:ornithine cyclodeaminase/alanine dehydrogenase-like protein (mu-crystallin family) [Psychrobacter sp. PL15]